MPSQPNMAICRALAIETSGSSGSVALVEDGNVLVEETFPHGLKHAAGLLPLIDRLMHRWCWKPADLQHLYVSQGPGSFTGLRIGVTFAKSLAVVSSAKIVPVPTLQVLAGNAPDEAGNLIVLLDARRGQIFASRYERLAGKWIEREPAHLDSLAGILGRAPRPVHLIGDGIPFHQQFLPAEQGAIIITTEDRWRARAAVVAQIGWEQAAQGIFADADHFTPAYVRKPEAEEKYDELHG